MPYGHGALERRLDLFGSIEEEAKRALLDIAEDAVEVPKGTFIRRENGPAEEFWVVADGWFYSAITLSDGGRQVYVFHLPGDVMGLQDLGWEIAVCDVAAATSATYIRFERERFREVIRRHPTLAGYFLTFGIYEHTRLMDRLRVVGRMPAIKRVAHLLLQLADEQAEPAALEAAADQDRIEFHLPIDQSLFGDALGLTNISVSRMMGELEDQGLVQRRGKRVRLPKLSALKAFCDYTERRRSVPLSWVLGWDRRQG